MDALSTIALSSVDAFSEPTLNVIVKPTDESRSSNTTMTSDGALVLTGLDVDATYIVRICVFEDTNATAWFDFKVLVTGADFYRIKRKTLPPSTTAYENVKVDATTSPIVYVTSTGTIGGYVELELIVHMSSAGGSKQVEFQWCQDTASGTTTVLAGSYLEWQKV